VFITPLNLGINHSLFFSMKKYFVLFLGLLSITASNSQSVYYPPLSSSATWETTSPSSLGWSPAKIDILYQFLEQENTKAFVVLKDGKIVLEKYFGTFVPDSVWYWASAGKTITSFLVGKAQEDGYLSIDDTSAKYLGAGWTNCTTTQENVITIRHQLTMTTGLDDGVTDNHCTTASCLQYKANPGTRWAYHNAPYTLLEKVLENATSTTINLYTQSKLKSKTGITGLWTMVDSDNVFFSTARSMARFGLLMQQKSVWNTDTLIRDKDYMNAMTAPSQQLNNSYGYLWWLNGQSSYMLPTVQYVFQGSYAPAAPVDMYAGLGKNGQIVSVSPMQGLVMVRMGNAPSGAVSEVPNQFCNLIWQKLNDAMQDNTGVNEQKNVDFEVYPNPATDYLSIRYDGRIESLSICDITGKHYDTVFLPNRASTLNVSRLPKGVYFVRIFSNKKFSRLFFLKS